VTTVFDNLLGELHTYLAGTADAVAGNFLADVDWAMPPRAQVPGDLRCLDHLDRLAEIACARERPLVAFIATHRDAFRWGQTYTAADFGQRFIENYGWLEVFGTRGHFCNDGMAAGVLVLGPDIGYPDHHHVAEEVYIPLTGGSLWRKGDGPYVSRAGGEVIHHPSNVNHAMRTGMEPLLALYLWRGGDLAQRSTVTGAVPEGAR